MPALMSAIAIVGSGFSGIALALQLLRAPGTAAQELLLFGPDPRPGGLAYAQAGAGHLLNVPAGNMSAWPQDPGHFLAHLRALGQAVEASSFVARRQYAYYLQASLAEAERQAPPGRRLRRLPLRVNDIRVAAGGHGLQLIDAQQRSHAVARAVLATGLPASEWPGPWAGTLANCPDALPDPWRPQALQALAERAGNTDLLLLGSGLSAVDAALSLQAAGHRGRLLCLSRQGRLPWPHRGRAQAPAALPESQLPVQGTLRQQLRSFRLACERLQAEGGDWRDLMASLRPQTAARWQAMSVADRSRFLRHLRGPWDRARHRLPPEAQIRLQALQREGRLQLLAGRLLAVEPRRGGLDLQWQPRGTRQAASLEVAGLINCSGPSSSLEQAGDGLIGRLLHSGLACRGSTGLGLHCTAEGGLIDAAGRPSDRLYLLGPLLRERDWEATAVPELRELAAALATTLLRGSPEPADKERNA